MRTLVLLRHAKSDWGAGIASDFDRPLNPRGSRNLQKMAAALAALELGIETIVSSPAVRAIETARAVAEGIGYGADNVVAKRSIYNAGRNSLLDAIAELPPDDASIMLVGHNPGMHEIAEYLSGEWLGKYPTCAAAVIDLPDSDTWANLPAGAGTLRQFVTPKGLG